MPLSTCLYPYLLRSVQLILGISITGGIYTHWDLEVLVIVIQLLFDY